MKSFTNSAIQGGIGKFPDCYCCNCLTERIWEGRPRSCFQKPIASVCHMIPRCEQALFLHECFFAFVFRFVCDGCKIKQHVHIKFWGKLGKSATKTPEMLRKAFGEHSLSWTAVFEWHSRFKAGQESVEDYECSGWSSSSKTTENVEKIRELIPEECCQTIHELSDTVGITYGVCQEMLTENLNMHHNAPSSWRAHPHIPENHRVCD
jgi:hypothetical protein